MKKKRSKSMQQEFDNRINDFKKIYKLSGGKRPFDKIKKIRKELEKRMNMLQY